MWQRGQFSQHALVASLKKKTKVEKRRATTEAAPAGVTSYAVRAIRGLIGSLRRIP
jgi:hypothetical protein